ncbi:MAG: hypothetical protein U9R79_04795 [Armatimonadota bacterium]|nr:hypothetical protein [Armatimonadota bacterium]
MVNRHRLRESYPAAVARWLSFGCGEFEMLPGAEDVGRFGAADAGPLAVEATALYAFIHGLAATREAFDLSDCPLDNEQCLEHALAAFRYCLRTHQCHPDPITEEPGWGGTGMSPKMADQLAIAAAGLGSALPDDDRDALRRLIEYEADCNRLLPFHLEHLDHGFYRKRPPVPTRRFGTSYPESNAWRACILARALLSSPGHQSAQQWRKAMLTFLANSLSVPADAEDDTDYDGRPLSEWHAGANLHPGFALEHHGFFHPGYVNRALLSLISAWIAFREAGEQPPELLLRNVPELWNVQRRLLLWKGRLAHPAGNDYPHYCWGQLYLLPVLAFMGHYYGDQVAREAEVALAESLMQEQEAGPDGSFCGCRLQSWRERLEEGVAPGRPAPSVYYRTLVDTPYYLSLAWWWHRRNATVAAPGGGDCCELDEPFIEPDCGLAFHRGDRRFASWSWNAHRSGVQGLVIPRNGDHLAEWEGNLLSRFHVRGASDGRRVLASRQWAFNGGIAARGRVSACEDTILHHLAFAALPDGITCIWLSHARALCELEVVMAEGLCLNLANDVFNDNRRRLHFEDRDVEVEGVGAASREILIDSPWVNIDDMLGVVEVDGCERFVLLVDGQRRATGHSLCYDTLLHPVQRMRRAEPGDTLEDSAVALLASTNARKTARWPAWHVGPSVNERGVRALTVRGFNDTWYLVAASWASTPAQIALPLTMETSGYRVLAGDPDRFRPAGVDALLSMPPNGMLIAALGGRR